jgi:hypothetical protein
MIANIMAIIIVPTNKGFSSASNIFILFANTFKIKSKTLKATL